MMKLTKTSDKYMAQNVLPGPGHSQEMKHIARNGEQYNGRMSPCCGNCARLGVRNSAHCQNHKIRGFSHVKHENMSVKTEAKFDPYSFTDEPNAQVKPERKPYNLGNAGFANGAPIPLKSDPNDYLSHRYLDKIHNDQLYNGRLNAKPKVQYQNMKEYPKVEKMEKVPKMKMNIEKPQIRKSFTNKPYGIKSSHALLKRSCNFYKAKLPAKRSKWRNNPKYKKKPKDDFADNLMKNLGYPPLTLEDLIAIKTTLKLPKGYQNGHATIASSVLSAENKTDNRDRVSPASKLVNGSGITVSPDMQHDNVSKGVDMESIPQKVLKPLRRSKSPDCLRSTSLDIDRLVPRTRSHSVDAYMTPATSKVQSKSQGHSDAMDEKMVGQLEGSDIDLVSSQIDQLRSKVTGNSENLQNNTVIEIPKCDCLGPDGRCFIPIHKQLKTKGLFCKVYN